jgi:hypothetical protein
MVTSQRPRTGERHAAALESTRRGAHRARPGALAAALPMLAVAAVVVIAVFALFQMFDNNGSAAEEPQNVAVGTPQPSGGPQPSGSADPSASASASPSAQEQAKVDPAAPVIVLNNTSTAGLGKKAATKLKGAGWTIKKIDNLTPRNQVASTTVFYAASKDQATAAAVATALGLGPATQSDHMGAAGITVVLAGDFHG